MSIELLWIIPIVAAALLVLVIALSLQPKDEQSRKKERDLKKEVEAYNSGMESSHEQNVITDTSEIRLRDIENTIQLVSTALSNQQKIIENFQGKDITLEQELDSLKKKLRELQKEYDITMSENYSLRARLKNVEKNLPDSPRHSEPADDTDAYERSKVLNVKLFEDTGKIDRSKPSELDDTSEINLKQYRK